MTDERDQDKRRFPGGSPGSEPSDNDPTRIRRSDGTPGDAVGNGRDQGGSRDGWSDPSDDGVYTSIPPQTILSNTHRIIEFIRRGGMGEVYRAYNQATGQENAIKIILPELASDPTVVEMFRREAEALRRVRNDAVVDYEGLFRDEHGRLYLAMEFVDGPSLVDFIKDGPLPSDQVRGLRGRLALGLASAHDRGVFHRDLTPDNIILRDGNLETPKIIDFGIAKFADTARETIVGSNFAGKYSFVSPEQLGMFGGKVDARSDIYSLGLVLAAAATGKPLPMGKTHAGIMEARLHVPDLSQVAPDLRDELAWMLQPNPDDRPQSMRELVTSQPGAAPSKPARGTGGGMKSPHTTGRRTGKPGGHGAGGRRYLSAAVILLMLTGAGGAYYYLAMLAMLDQQETPERQRQAEVPPTPTSSPRHEVPPPHETLAPRQTPAPQVPADPRPLQAALDRIFEQFECSSLMADVVRDQEAFHVKVSGYLSSSADRRLLENRMSAIPGVGRFDNLAEIQPKPFCTILDTVQAMATSDGPGIEPDRYNQAYLEGQELIVKVTATTAFDGFLYVDLFDAQGNVIHLLPTAVRKENRVAAGQEITIGTTRDRAGPGERYYEVEAPFGRNMIVAVSSRRPLFDMARLEMEPATTYLADLGQRLKAMSSANAPGGDVMTAYEFIITSARDAIGEAR